MDWTEMITAMLAACSAMVGSALVQSKQMAILQTKLEALTRDLAVLSTRVDKHNQLQERTLKNEMEIASLKREREGGRGQ